MTRRPLPSSGTLSWSLPDHYYLGSVTFYSPESLPPVLAYVGYSQQETINGREFFVAAGVSGAGQDLPSAIASALPKLETLLAERRRQCASSPPPSAPITLNINLDELEFKL